MTITDYKGFKLLNETSNFQLIGSLAFNVENDESDIDIAVLKSDLTEIAQGLLTDTMHIKNYFGYVPLNNGWLIRKIDMPNTKRLLDLIVFERQEDLDVLGKAVQDLKQCPSYLLEDKSMRLQLFEKSLQFYGFTNTRF